MFFFSRHFATRKRRAISGRVKGLSSSAQVKRVKFHRKAADSFGSPRPERGPPSSPSFASPVTTCRLKIRRRKDKKKWERKCRDGRPSAFPTLPPPRPLPGGGRVEGTARYSSTSPRRLPLPAPFSSAPPSPAPWVNAVCKCRRGKGWRPKGL